MKNFSQIALEGKYSNFKNAIVSEMAKRMSENKYISEYNRQMDYYNNVSNYMRSIPSLDEYKRGV